MQLKQFENNTRRLNAALDHPAEPISVRNLHDSSTPSRSNITNSRMKLELDTLQDKIRLLESKLWHDSGTAAPRETVVSDRERHDQQRHMFDRNPLTEFVNSFESTAIPPPGHIGTKSTLPHTWDTQRPKLLSGTSREPRTRRETSRARPSTRPRQKPPMGGENRLQKEAATWKKKYEGAIKDCQIARAECKTLKEKYEASETLRKQQQQLIEGLQKCLRKFDAQPKAKKKGKKKSRNLSKGNATERPREHEDTTRSQVVSFRKA